MEGGEVPAGEVPGALREGVGGVVSVMLGWVGCAPFVVVYHCVTDCSKQGC